MVLADFGGIAMPKGSATCGGSCTKPTLGQGNELSKVILESGIERENFQALLESGVLSDLLSVDARFINRGAVQVALGLKDQQKMVELTLNPENPEPFKQPFLVLDVGTGGGDIGSETWYVDVGGAIERYIDHEAPRGHVDLSEHTTELMKEMLKQFRRVGRASVVVGTYRGSAGPTHILRNGAFFRRVGIAQVRQ